jgi:hypothetical protein
MHYKHILCVLVAKQPFIPLFVPYTMSSDFDDRSVNSTIRSRRCRERRRADVAPRPVASPDEQRHLLSLPYGTLTEQQKNRVRYYRRRDRIQQQHEQSSRPQSNDHVQQQAQLVASRFNGISNTTTPPVMPPASMDTMPSSHQPLTGMSSQSSIPPFIPVAMIPSSCFTTMFPHVTTSSTIPVVFQSQPTTSLPVVFQQQPMQPLPPPSVQHVQPITTSLSIMNQSDVDSPSVPQTPHQPSVTSSEISRQRKFSLECKDEQQPHYMA